MENEIIKMRRVSINEEHQDYKYRMVKNPLYNTRDLKMAMENGWGYYQEEFIEKEIPFTRIQKRTHIEYLKECAYCKSQHWVRRRDAKYCTASCRKLAYLERKG